MLTIRNLEKDYGGFPVLERVTLDIKDGCFCGIVGPSGCGKSTFLRILLGQEAPSRGELLLDGVPLPNEPSTERGIVFQRYSAQALMKRPRVLLLDEPFGALDPGVRLEMHDLLLELWREHGMTIFMVTHDISEAFKLSTRVLTFDKVRSDPQFPDAYGATVTYDLSVDGTAFPDNIVKDDPNAELG